MASDSAPGPGIRISTPAAEVGAAPPMVVGLGGSAGALKAFEQFFRAMPADSGLAFVVVMHLMPDQPSELATVLQGFTSMPVVEATDGQRVAPDHVYVIPPNRDMSLLHGTLLLFAPTAAAGRRLPIDFFFQSLANDAQERAVAVICSGMGGDGTTGLKAVMENCGLVMVQDPATAEFDSMPRSAIATGFADYVLPAGQLPAQLLQYVAHPPTRVPRPDDQTAPAAQPDHALQKIFLLVRARTGHDFSHYKRNTMLRRIERRMNSHHLKEFGNYVRYLQENPDEVDALFRELLIGVTRFFRDPEAFGRLQSELLPLLRQKPANSVVRVWAPGCSTGEEAYTLAMCLLECLDGLERTKGLKIQVFATDINSAGIDFARTGTYGPGIMADVSPGRLRRFFVQTEKGYQIKKEVRDTVIFALHDINKDAPFTRLDLLVCRNLLIYLSSALQRNLIPIFHYALLPKALLMLGPSENLTGFQDLFEPLDVKWKISRRTATAASLSRLLHFPFATSRMASLPMSTSDAAHAGPTRKQGPFATLVQRLLLRHYTPPAVVINAKGDILYVNGRTGRYLEPAPGLGRLNIFEMAREELNYEISGAVHRAQAARDTVVVDKARVKTDAGTQLLRITVRPLTEPEALAGLLLVVFEDQPTPRRLRRGQADARPDLSRDAVVQSLEKELSFYKHRLQTTVEEMESSVEELKSTNEELQSANEELQSTNEEAMTNKEELQSLNEELMTLNTQYLSKTEELSQAANDMKNLLDATEIATIFLDNDMVIKRFTPPVARIIALLPADVGRPITHFAANISPAGLADDVRQVLDRLVSVERTIQTTSDEWYAMRILPYRTLDNYISGAVITFTDITNLKALEADLHDTARLAESIIESMPAPLLALDPQLRILTVSPAFARQFGLDRAAVKGQLLHELAGVWQSAALRQRLDGLLANTQATFDDFPLPTPTGAPPLLLYGRSITSGGVHTDQLLLGVRQG